MGTCVSRTGDKQRECTYLLASSALKLGARTVPKSVGVCRFVCDTRVPSFMLAHDVRIEAEAISTSEGELALEWVIPERLHHAALGGEASVSSVGSGEEPPGTSLAGRTHPVMLYMHGGAFVLCTPGSLRGCTSPIARAIGASLCVPEYRRPPECQISAAVEDGLTAYKYLLEQFPASDIYLGGESAGAALAANMLLEMRRRRLTLPRRVLFMSPWMDLGGSREEAGLRHASVENEQHDYLPLGLINFFAEQARGEYSCESLPASPIYVDESLADLPPLLVIYGQDEVLCGQIEHFCDVWTARGANLIKHGVVDGLHAPILFSFCHEPSYKALEVLMGFFTAAAP